MAVRSYNFPSSEVKEVDLTNAAVNESGSVVLVCGYAHKGPIFTPTRVYTTSTYVNIFGEPLTDAEFYLYTAVDNIIADGGVPLIIRLPYNNEASKNYNAVSLAISEANVISSYSTDSDYGMLQATTTKHGFSKACKLTTASLALTNAEMAKVSANSDFAGITNAVGKNFLIVDKNKSICADINHRGGMFVVVFDALRGMLIQRLLDDGANDESTLLKEKINLIDSVAPLGADVEAIGNWSIALNGTIVDRYNPTDDASAYVLTADTEKESDKTYYKLVDSNYVETTVDDWYELTNDTSVVSGKTYYGKSGSTYTAVQSPEENPKTSGYYEAITDPSAAGYYEENPNKKYVWVYAEDSLSKQIASLFPTFETKMVEEDGITTTELDPEYANYIGIAVCKITESDSLVAKNVPTIVESFVGSVVPKRNRMTGTSEYIVDKVNSGSSYITMIANRLNQTEKDQTGDGMLSLPVEGSLDGLIFSASDNMDVKLNSFNYGSNDKLISGVTIEADLITALAKVDNVDNVQIDTVCDAGLSSIGQFCNTTGGEHYQPDIDIDTANAQITTANQIVVWSRVANKLEQFCSGTRKDCMALIDAPRHATLKGASPIINDYDYTKTFANDEEYGFGLISTALNSSYAAVYSNWVKTYNGYTNTETWVPASCYVAGACCRCDIRYNPWNSPAFLERGVITNITDLSLRPGKDEESFLYPKSLNYVKYFTNEGFVIWGQKTTQKKEGAFSRINVRRSVLRMERYIYQVGRSFIGKGNSVYNRRLWIDILDPYLSSIKSAGGLYDYMLICDEGNNTGAVIDANEFRGTVLLKPVKEAEFVVATVVATNTDAVFSEVIASGNF